MAKKSPVPWILLALGAILLVGGTVWGIVRVVSDVGSLLPQQTWTSGAPQSVQLEAGDWAVYELSAVSRAGRAAPSVDPAAITVTGPAGERIATTCLSCGVVSQSATINGDDYLGVVEFTAPAAGDYTITAEGKGNRLAVGRPVTDAFGSLFGSIFLAVGLGVLGFMLGMAGFIWLIVRAVNGRKSTVPPGFAAPAAPGTAVSGTAPRGWYHDASSPGQLRWWDGSQWTENVKPAEPGSWQ